MGDDEQTSNRSPQLSDGTDISWRRNITPADSDPQDVHVQPSTRFSGARFQSMPSFGGGSGKISKLFRASRWSATESEISKPGDNVIKSIFADPDTMKEKVRDKLVKRKVYNVADYYKTEGPWQYVARHRLFENFTLGVIAFNAVWIAVDTDYNDAELLTDADPIFQIMENAFCAFFTLELTIRFMSFKRKINACKDLWFVFDSSLVTVMVLETWVMSIIFALSGGGGGGGLGNTSILRIARLLRLSRMARMARLLRVTPELMVMIKGMLTATRSVFFTLCLLTIIMYVFAIALTQMLVGTPAGTDHFASVIMSMKTLLIHGTLLDDVVVIINKVEGFVLFMFLFYILLAAWTVLNMLVGVLCEVVSAVAATEREENLVCYVKGHIEKLVSELDADGDGTISKNEFVHILDNAQAVRALSEVGVDPIELVDFADYIFEDPQDKGSNQEKELKFDEFMRMVLQLRGSNTATVKDIIDLRKFVRHTSTETYKSIDSVTHCINGLERRVESCFEALSKGSPLPAAERSPKKLNTLQGATLNDHSQTFKKQLSPEQSNHAKSAEQSCEGSGVAIDEDVAERNQVQLERLGHSKNDVEHLPEDHGQCWLPLPTPPTQLLRDKSWESLGFVCQHQFKPPWPASSMRGPNAKWLAAAEEDNRTFQKRNVHKAVAGPIETRNNLAQGNNQGPKLVNSL